MNRLTDTASSQHTSEDCPKTLAVRTYRQIAEIFVDRGGTPINPARAAQICRVAEMKLAHALLADPVIRERLRPSAAHGHQAKQLGERNVHHPNNTAVSMECAETSSLYVWSQS